MKTKVFFTFLILLCLQALKSQTYITSSDSVLCSGNSATLTAHHDFFHNFCVWTPGGVAPSIVVSPTITTTYSVTCYDADANATYASFTQNVAICTGIKKELGNTIIEIFPNPSSDKITIFGLEKNTSIEIYNALGAITYKTLAEDETKQVGLEGYKPGIYFIKIKSGKQEFTRKIIKQ